MKKSTFVKVTRIVINEKLKAIKGIIKSIMI